MSKIFAMLQIIAAIVGQWMPGLETWSNFGAAQSGGKGGEDKSGEAIK